MNTALAINPAPVSAVQPKSKLSFGALSTKKASARAAYAAIPDDLDKLAELAKNLRATRQQLQALTGSEQLLVYEIKNLVKKHAFKTWHGQLQVPSGLQVNVPGEEPVLTLLTSRYNIAKGDKEKQPNLQRFESSLRQVLGDRYDQCFKDGFKVAVDGELIPVEKQQAFIDGLSQLVVSLGIDAEAVQATPTIKHTTDFHVRRHSLLTPEENLAVDEAYPMVIQIKTEHKAS